MIFYFKVKQISYRRVFIWLQNTKFKYKILHLPRITIDIILNNELKEITLSTYSRIKQFTTMNYTDLLIIQNILDDKYLAIHTALMEELKQYLAQQISKNNLIPNKQGISDFIINDIFVSNYMYINTSELEEFLPKEFLVKHPEWR